MNSVVILFYYRVHTIIFICQSSDIITRLITITSMSNNNNRERERGLNLLLLHLPMYTLPVLLLVVL